MIWLLLSLSLDFKAKKRNCGEKVVTRPLTSQVESGWEATCCFFVKVIAVDSVAGPVVSCHHY